MKLSFIFVFAMLGNFYTFHDMQNCVVLMCAIVCHSAGCYASLSHETVDAALSHAVCASVQCSSAFSHFVFTHSWFWHFYAFAGNYPLKALCFWAVCVSVSLWMCYLINHLWEFYQVYNVSAVGDKDELLDFEGRRSRRSRSQQNHIWSDEHFESHFLICLRSAWNSLLYITLMTFSRS